MTTILAALYAAGLILPARTPAPRMQQNFFDDVKNVADGVVDAYADPNFVPDGFVRASHIIFLAADDAGAYTAAFSSREFASSPPPVAHAA